VPVVALANRGSDRCGDTADWVVCCEFWIFPG